MQLVRSFLFLAFTFSFVFAVNTFAQKKSKKTVSKPLPIVLQINDESIKDVVKPDGKPLLINFWATWCDPCREEFPFLVTLDQEYRGKIDIRTISLDDPVEKTRDVPKFLAKMNATMPAFLLFSPNESDIIGSLSRNWNGGLPFTLLYKANGELAYSRLGKLRLETARNEINKLITSEAGKKVEACDPQNTKSTLPLKKSSD